MDRCLTNCGIEGLINPIDVLRILMLSLRYNNHKINLNHPISLELGENVLKFILNKVNKNFNKKLPKTNSGLAIIYSFYNEKKYSKIGSFSKFKKDFLNSKKKILINNRNYELIKVYPCNCRDAHIKLMVENIKNKNNIFEKIIIILGKNDIDWELFNIN
jgi:hypothetical protein